MAIDHRTLINRKDLAVRPTLAGTWGDGNVASFRPTRPWCSVAVLHNGRAEIA